MLCKQRNSYATSIGWQVLRPNAGQHPASCSWGCSLHRPLRFTSSAHTAELISFLIIILLDIYPSILWICYVDVSTYFAHMAKIRVFHWGQYLLSCSYWCQNMGPSDRLERRASPLEKRKLFSLLWDPEFISSPGWLNLLHVGHFV